MRALMGTVPDRDERPLIVHVIHRLHTGGMENGLVNLINGMDPGAFRHAIVCMTDHTEFRDRLQRTDVPLFALHKREGKDLKVLARLWRTLRALRPTIVHTRNFGTLECQVPAALAGVPLRVHGEHGWEVNDLNGVNPRRRRLRRLLRPAVHRYIALSKQIERYLVESVGVPPRRVAQIYNGVDTQRFRPAQAQRAALPLPGDVGPETVVIGTVGRLDPVKDQKALVQAFLALVGASEEYRRRLRLVIAGDGPVRKELLAALEAAGAADLAWLPGDCGNVPDILRGLDLFVLPSLAEGISNTVLEAMASGLPIVASAVGGNPELVADGETGALVPAGDSGALAAAIERYLHEPRRRLAHGQAARRRAEAHFSLDGMIAAYTGFYQSLTAQRRRALTLG